MLWCMHSKISKYCGRPDSLQDDMARIIRKRRIKAGLSIQDVADRLNTTYNTVQRWETNEVTMQWPRILDLCKLFRCTVRHLLPRGA